jgi:3-oxoacyl-[acyl-carrier protein] reductase
MRLEGKVAIVTGGGKGIGKAYTKGLASEGARVVMAEIDVAAVARTEDEFRRQDLDVTAIPTDVTDEASVNKMVEETISRYGRIDILVNNAAYFAALPDHKSWLEIDVKEWDQVMAVNLRGVFLCAKAVGAHMQEQQSGSIINVASSTFINGGQTGVHYTASKAGVMGFTRGLARNLGPFGVRANSIAPGATLSETVLEHRDAGVFDRLANMRSIKRNEKPEDLVGTVIFLASDDSAFITGQMLVVDGGKDLW